MYMCLGCLLKPVTSLQTSDSRKRQPEAKVDIFSNKDQLRTDTGGGSVIRATPILNRVFILFHVLNTCIIQH